MANTLDSTREQLTYKAGLQIFFLIIAIILTMLFTLPKLEEVKAQVNSANEAVEKLNTISSNGISVDNLIPTIQQFGENTELVEVINKAGDTIAPIITKTENKPYLEWLKENSLNDDADRAKLADAQAKINSIIPTISPISNNRTSKSVTLREYTTFIEEKLLSKFGINSLSPIGIDGVKYQESEDWLAHPVGEMNVELNFKANNKSIIDLLDFIQTLWEPSLLSRKEILENPPSIMSNPLITINSLSLSKFLNPSEPFTENTGRLSLTFYVRGSSTTDINYLIEAFNKRKTALGNEINTKMEECKKEWCPGMTEYEKVYKKFQFFNQSLSDILKKDGNTVETAYIIRQQLQSLQSLRSEFENIK